MATGAYVVGVGVRLQGSGSGLAAHVEVKCRVKVEGLDERLLKRLEGLVLGVKGFKAKHEPEAALEQQLV